MLIVLHGPSEVTFTLQQLRHQWATPAMTTFLLVLVTLLCALQWAHRRIAGGSLQLQLQPRLVPNAASGSSGTVAAGTGMEAALDGPGVHMHRLQSDPATANSSKWAGGTGSGGASSSSSSSSMGTLLPREQDAVLLFTGALLFSAVASFVGAWSVLFSKSLTYVVSYLPGSLWDPYSWIVLALFLGTAAFWVRQSDRGLRYYPASLIMPLMQVRLPLPALLPLLMLPPVRPFALLRRS